MKKTWKELLLATMGATFLTTGIAFASTVNMNLTYNGKTHAYQAKEVKILIDGQELATKDMPAVIVDGRTMLPMRVIAQALGGDVLWNEENKQAFIISDTHTVGFTINGKIAQKNGVDMALDVPAMIINDRTMLPVRALAKALDLDVTWNESNRTVSIGGGTQAPETPEKPAEPEKPKDPETSLPPAETEGRLTRVSVPQAGADQQIFTIESNSPISKFDETFVDNSKIVLDFHNATNGLSEKITATNSSMVSAIRTAEHQVDGSTYTRVVLDLAGKKGYTVSQSGDKKSVSIIFEKTQIEDISMQSRGDADEIVISADSAMGAKVSTLTNPQRIVIDIPYATTTLDETLSVKDLNLVTAARTGVMNTDTIRIVLEVGQLTNYTWEEKNQELRIEVTKSTLENMAYDSISNRLELKKTKDLDIDAIQKNDRYLNGYYELILPGNYEGAYGYGSLNIGNDVIDNFKLETQGGATVIRFNQSRISEYVITEEADAYVISVKNPKEVYNKVLLLDGGHGGSAPGTTGNGLVEKNINLSMILKVNNNLRNSGIKVYLTRDSDTNPENNLRAKTANQIADAMVSIHMNSVVGNTTANGTETLYQVHSNDNNSKLTSRKAAEIMQSHVVSTLGTTNRGVKQRPDLLILNSTTVPAILVEVCFLSNPGDAIKISSEANQELAAKAIANAIEEMMSYPLR